MFAAQDHKKKQQGAIYNLKNELRHQSKEIDEQRVKI
jgi:hypothetical protein